MLGVALYTQESVARVRDAVDFVELASAYTELRRVGSTSYEGLCPFHEERTPSFGIEPQRKVYYCFGCQASGDVITFVQAVEGLNFRGAVELLADRCSLQLELEREDPKDAARRERRARLLGVMQRACAYYERYLWESENAQAARTNLAERGLGEDILRAFHVGFAPAVGEMLLALARDSGFTEAEMLAAGLARAGNGRTLSDRFRGRIMFPLADLRGHVIGFGARAAREGQQPKYLNSPEGDLYHKGLHLYGADLARAHATRAGKVLLCEGYTDVIALHQAGLQNAVGLMGTALTAEQVSELARMAQTVLLALDADSAGQEAMLRASTLAARRKLELRVVALPVDTDPAELLARDGVEAMNDAVSRSVPFVSFRVQQILDRGDNSSPEGRDRMIEELRPVFATLPPSAMRMDLTRLVSGHLELPESLAQTLLGSSDSSNRPPVSGGQGSGGSSGRPMARAQSGAPAAAAVLSRHEDTERAFLALCIASPGVGAKMLAEASLDEHFSDPLLRRAAAYLRAHGLADPLAEAQFEHHDALRDVLAALLVQASREQASGPALLETQACQLRLSAVERQLRSARSSGASTIAALAAQRVQAKQALDDAYARAIESGEADGGAG